jgi:pilus assembly protein Flp/PilA
VLEFVKIILDAQFARAPRSERGATGVEYGLMVGLIAAVIIAVVVVLGQAVNTSFDSMIGTF